MRYILIRLTTARSKALHPAFGESNNNCTEWAIKTVPLHVS